LMVAASYRGSGVDKPVSTSSGLSSALRSAIRGRATVKFEDNFRAGLGAWTGNDKVRSKDWSFDQAGLKPGKLRLWTPSIKMADYQMEFLGQIERKSMGWAYRAADVQNYYATKITIMKPGPLPSADLVRFAVVNGKEDSRVHLPLPMTIRNDTLYRVQVQVAGNQFSTLLNGQIVDTWNDSRIRAGGVGFFSESGEIARVRWIRVSDRDTVLGRILSHLSLAVPAVE